MELYEMKAFELNKLIRNKELSAVEVCQSYLDRIEKTEEKMHSYLTITAESALEKAKEVDEKIREGKTIGALAGVPIAVKDNICTKDIKTTCASKILQNFIPPYNATVYEKLLEADMVMLGKTNMDEFAMGSTTENSAFQKTNNPWDFDRVPGGSSGGSAASVASNQAALSLGSDTGGSIRQPASFCGVVGMKPTYGAISRYGLVAFASSLDQIGPIAKDVRDCANLFKAILGYDPKDSTSAPVSYKEEGSLEDGVKGLKIGVPKEYMGQGIEPRVKAIIEDAIRLYSSLGAEIAETSLPHVEYAVPCYYIIAPAEASSNLARYDGVRYGYRSENTKDVLEMFIKSRSEGFGAEVKRRIMLGTYALSSGYYDAYYLKALKVRNLIKQDFDKAFLDFDLLLSPTCPSPAGLKGENLDNPLQMYLSDITTIPVNLAGLPGISVPAGKIGNLPVGLQLIAKPFSEGQMLKAAYAFEQNTEYQKNKLDF